MQAVVKAPRMLENGAPVEFTISGNVPAFYMDLTRRLFGVVEERASDGGKDSVKVSKSDWYKEIEAKTTPGNALRSARAARKMMQKDLAAKLKIMPQQLSNMESGRAPIGRSMAVRIGNALGVDWRLFI